MDVNIGAQRVQRADLLVYLTDYSLESCVSLLSDWSDWKGDLPPTFCLFCEESYSATNQVLQHMKVHPPLPCTV